MKTLLLVIQKFLFKQVFGILVITYLTIIPQFCIFQPKYFLVFGKEIAFKCIFSFQGDYFLFHKCKHQFQHFLFKKFVSCKQGINLSRPDPGRGQKINLNFYFHSSLLCLKRFYEGLK